MSGKDSVHDYKIRLTDYKLVITLPSATNTTIELNDVRGHKYVFGPTQTHFSPSTARVKLSLRRAKNILFYAQEHQLYYNYDKFKGQYTAQK